MLLEVYLIAKKFSILIGGREGDFVVLCDKCSEIYIFELKMDKVKRGREIL